jgi:hypothetical protein
LKLEPWEPDLRSLHSRYQEGSLDLQPAFQRGLVWSREKKARLIDTILRGWRMPPVHLVVESDETLSVLDGQQRLQSLFEFIDDRFPVGAFPPFDSVVSDFEGYRYSQLPETVRRRFLSSRVSTYRLYDYQPEEPYELFFRLNLPTGLTPAEKRNALAGDTREQIRTLVNRAERDGWGKPLLGFGDGRMAYDDVIARTCAYVERGTIDAPLTPKDMEHAYRREGGFERDTIDTVQSAIEIVTRNLRDNPMNVRMNKATLLTWLLVGSRATRAHVSPRLADAIAGLESYRTPHQSHGLFTVNILERAEWFSLLDLYNDRASLRVADVLSIRVRDTIAWLAVASTNPTDQVPESVVQFQKYVFSFAPPERHLALLDGVGNRGGWGLLT